MKTPSTCPVCQAPLLNEAVPTVGLPYWRKSCTQYNNHRIVLATVGGNDDRVSRLTIALAADKLFTWFLEANMCFSSKTWDLERRCEVPYFEPDFSDYPKLVAKIQMYVLFS